MDIMGAEKQKAYIRIGIKLLRKKLGSCATAENIHEDISSSINPVVRELADIINIGANKLAPKYQRRTVAELSELALWIVVKDTAYRDVFFWILDQVLKRAEKLRELIKPYVKDPSEWYPNMWVESKKSTKEKKQSGEIPDFEKSASEKIFTPTTQQEALRKYK